MVIFVSEPETGLSEETQTDAIETKEELTEKLSSLFSTNNVAILNTETTSIILRPSDISSIVVEQDLTEVINKQLEIISSPQKVEPEAIDLPRQRAAIVCESESGVGSE